MKKLDSIEAELITRAVLRVSCHLAELLTLILLVCRLIGATGMSYFWVFFPCVLQVVAVLISIVFKALKNACQDGKR